MRERPARPSGPGRDAPWRTGGRSSRPCAAPTARPGGRPQGPCTPHPPLRRRGWEAGAAALSRHLPGEALWAPAGGLAPRLLPGQLQAPGFQDGVVHVRDVLVREEGDVEGPEQLGRPGEQERRCKGVTTGRSAACQTFAPCPSPPAAPPPAKAAYRIKPPGKSFTRLEPAGPVGQVGGA